MTSLTAGVTRGYVASAFARSACASRIGLRCGSFSSLSFFSRRFVSVSFSSLSFSTTRPPASTAYVGFGAAAVAAPPAAAAAAGKGASAPHSKAVAPLR